MLTITQSADTSLPVEADRPLRRDAQRNRERILLAARELFAERGLGVTLNDVAHHAGVGVGTVYRRFPDKAALIESLFDQTFEEIVGLMEQALADPEPRRGLERFMESMFERQCRDQGLSELVTEAPEGFSRIARIRERLLPMSAELVRRGQAAGVLASDIDPSDLAILQLMIGSVIDANRGVAPELWRRYFAILLRGISAPGAERPPLAPGPLTPEQVDTVLTRHKTSRR